MKQIGPLLAQPQKQFLLVFQHPVQAAVQAILFGHREIGSEQRIHGGSQVPLAMHAKLALREVGGEIPPAYSPEFVEVMANFPTECRLVLEKLGSVYHNDALARRGQLSADERLRFHQQHSRPVMEALEGWMKAQLDEHLTEPNSGLGQAIQYMLRHWNALTLFLRQPNAPLDNTLSSVRSKKPYFIERTRSTLKPKTAPRLATCS